MSTEINDKVAAPAAAVSTGPDAREEVVNDKTEKAATVTASLTPQPKMCDNETEQQAPIRVVSEIVVGKDEKKEQGPTSVFESSKSSEKPSAGKHEPPASPIFKFGFSNGDLSAPDISTARLDYLVKHHLKPVRPGSSVETHIFTWNSNEKAISNYFILYPPRNELFNEFRGSPARPTLFEYLEQFFGTFANEKLVDTILAIIDKVMEERGPEWFNVNVRCKVWAAPGGSGVVVKVIFTIAMDDTFANLPFDEAVLGSEADDGDYTPSESSGRGSVRSSQICTVLSPKSEIPNLT